MPDNDGSPELLAAIAEATGRIGDPNDWSEAERERAIQEGWIRIRPRSTNG